jgi:hypothetical protein
VCGWEGIFIMAGGDKEEFLNTMEETLTGAPA